MKKEILLIHNGSSITYADPHEAARSYAKAVIDGVNPNEIELYTDIAVNLKDQAKLMKRFNQELSKIVNTRIPMIEKNTKELSNEMENSHQIYIGISKESIKRKRIRKTKISRAWLKENLALEFTLAKQVLKFSLTSGKRAEINVPPMLNKQDIKILKSQLSVMEMQTKISNEDMKRKRIRKTKISRL